MGKVFNYERAFSRNIGWVTTEEQAALRGKRVAIAGMGGVGGAHLLTLARLGVGAFHIADFDCFDVVNFNRQVGATMTNLGEPKCGVLEAMVHDINPEADVKVFPSGVDSSNVSEFLDKADLYIDGLDFFAFGARQMTFAACQAQHVPAITAAPLGMGTALLTFLPGRMSFEEYFCWGDVSDEERALRFLIGLAPAGLHRSYLVDPSTVSFSEQRGPSSIMACELCAGVAATEALKILLGRGNVVAAPHGMQFDAYRNKLVHTWRPGGNRHPLQRLMLALARRQFARQEPPR